MTPTRTSPPVTEELNAGQRERRDRIIEAALVLTRRRSVGGIQVKDVAEQAGVSLGTVYRYFSSKDHLFAEALVRWAADLRTSVARRPPAGASAAERLTEVLHRSVRAFQHQPNLARLLTTLQVSPDPSAAEIIARLDRTTTEVYLGVLDGVDPDTAYAMVRVVDLVFASLLRLWSAGRMPTMDVYDHLDRTVGLLFRP